MLNTDHPLVRSVNDGLNAATAERLAPIDAELRGLRARLQAIETAQQHTKPEDVTEEEKNELKQVNDQIAEQNTQREAVLADYAARTKSCRSSLTWRCCKTVSCAARRSMPS